jgi:uncharacterized SAM-binding protein YcdF (DUF218 family)
VWAAAGIVVAGLLVIVYTPLVPSLLRGLERRDELAPAPAVVVLGSVAWDEQTLSAAAQERFVHGYAVVRQGYAPRLIITRPPPPEKSWDAAVRRQIRDLGFDFPLDVVGPAGDTHEEAVAIAALARERGWDRVVLVTHPWHMRRAAAAFEKAGLKVICSPCAEGAHNLVEAKGPRDRLGGFRYWIREAVGYRVYQVRGWI